MLLWLKPKLNQHFYSLTAKVFWIVINITLISNIQSIISIVHDIYFIIKHDNNFLLILQVPVLWIFLWILFLKYLKHLLFSKTLVFTMTYCCNNIFINTLCLFMLTTIIYQKQMHLWLQSNKFFNSNITCVTFYFILPTTNLFESLCFD